MKKKRFDKVYWAIGMIGILIWVGTILLREHNDGSNAALNFILGITPNFGAVFAFVGLYITACSQFFPKKFQENMVPILAGGVFILGLVSEVFHHFFLDAPFDIWDMAASLTAVIILLLIHKRHPAKAVVKS